MTGGDAGDPWSRARKFSPAGPRHPQPRHGGLSASAHFSWLQPQLRPDLPSGTGASQSSQPFSELSGCPVLLLGSPSPVLSSSLVQLEPVPNLLVLVHQLLTQCWVLSIS